MMFSQLLVPQQSLLEARLCQANADEQRDPKRNLDHDPWFAPEVRMEADATIMQNTVGSSYSFAVPDDLL